MTPPQHWFSETGGASFKQALPRRNPGTAWRHGNATSRQDQLSSALVIFFIRTKSATCLFLPTHLEGPEITLHLMLITFTVNPLFIDLAQNNLCLVLN